jgi:glycosyl transferase family 2
VIDGATLICATTMRNEAWILRRFLECALTWADHVIVVDDNSTDGSAEIAARFPNVRLLRFQRFDDVAPYESERWRMRIEAAREIEVSGKRVVMTLDSDEMLSANFGADLRRVVAAEPGTNVAARVTNLLPGLEQCWVPPDPCVIGFVDDGSPFTVEKSMHVLRVPPGPTMELSETVLLHCKLLAARRVQARHRYYQVWETESGLRSSLGQYRLYHRGERPEKWMEPVRAEWLSGYFEAGIDLHRVDDDPAHFDALSLRLIAQRGPSAFKRADIWSIDWNRVAEEQGVPLDVPIVDPRGPGTKLAHRWLAATQGSERTLPIRVGEGLLRARGW